MKLLPVLSILALASALSTAATLPPSAQDSAEQVAIASPITAGQSAGPRVKHVHANAEHPAVIVAAREAALDPNMFIVQPPASVHWTLEPTPATR